MNDFTRQGWVRVYRKSIDSTVWKNPNVWFVWSWCLLKATHETHKFPFNGEDIEIKAGQFITGINKAINELNGLSAQNYRTAITYLKSTGRITTQSNNKFSIITIVKWEDYQKDNTKLTDKLTNEQQTTNKPLTTYNNNKNDKNIEREAEASPTPKDNSKFFFKGIRDFQKKENTTEATSMAELLKKMSLDQGLESPQRKKAFWDEVVKFGDYWQEKDQLGKKERWQMQRTFEVEKRLQTWLKKAGQWSKPASYINKNTPNYVL